MTKKANAFTIVELLIVIVVIAILAAISIVSYTGIQNRAVESSIKSDLSNFKKKIELAKVDATDGLYPSVPTVAMDIRFTRSSYKTDRNNLYYCVSPDRTQFALGGVSKRGDNFGYVVTSTSAVEGPVTNIWAASVCARVGAPDTAYQAGFLSPSWTSWAN